VCHNPGAVSRRDRDEDEDLIELRPEDADDEPPVVARLVIEIRSDGRRTIARGAMEDAQSGQKVAIEARGTTPLSLAASLARAMFRLPTFAGTAVRALLPGRRRRRGGR
jgi:hypothetical protein